MNFVIGPVLGILSVVDMREKKIPVRPVLFMGIVLLIMRLYEGVSAGELVCGLLPGTVLLLVAWLTREKFGVGDGLVVLCLGFGYGIETMMTIMGVAFAAAALLSIVLMVFRRATRKTELPFLPFLLVGWVVSVFVS